ncbi:MAG TPA: PIG-L deacetylase family protein [Planctomycetota bacterium]|nr:PIG-L deacetylase family protein [Planctomycetota bacterium]
MASISRRDLFLGGAASLLPLAAPQEKRKLKVLCAGGHPDDPESGAGGTMARYADLGHDAANLYLTKGEAGIPGKTADQAALIRSLEIEKACAILKVRALFVGQIDGATEVQAARYDEVRRILADERPDVVLTHWPIDTHRDHRAMSLLVYDAWLRLGRTFALYYFEVDMGAQTQHFHPSHYVDISAVVDRKKDACYAHASQKPAGFYDAYHEPMQKHRGMEAGVQAAEAFIRHLRSRDEVLP